MKLLLFHMFCVQYLLEGLMKDCFETKGLPSLNKEFSYLRLNVLSVDIGFNNLLEVY